MGLSRALPLTSMLQNLQCSKLIIYVYITLIICSAQEDYSIIPPFFRISSKQLQRLRDLILNVVGRTASSPGNLGRLERLGRIQRRIDTFPCNTTGFRSSKRPKSVHRLQPGDIDVIGALGDSLTAGNGAAATNIFHVYTENRGISWSIGGQGLWNEYLTLPNILKEFNPKLFGYSLSDSHTHHRASQFNVGEIGAMSRDIPYMATLLVKRIKNDKRVNFQEDWKLVTLMVGSNDFCLDVCYLKNVYKSIEYHRNDLMKTIEYLKENLPRTLLQIVVSPNLNIIINFKGLSGICKLAHTTECPCLIGLPFSHKRKDMLKVMEAWQNVEMEVASNPNYTTDTFAVVYQPFTQKLTFPTKRNAYGNVVTDVTYLSQDCFHFSQKGYSRAANALWNNLLQPVGQKTTNWIEEFSQFNCPTQENPFIFTNKNS